MLKRILYGSGAFGALTAGYLLGSVALSPAFAQTATPSATPSQAQAEPAEKQGTETGNDQAESAALASQAKITADQANAAALGQFPGGTVKKTSLDDENGTVVYSVELTDSAGTAQEVKVDAASAKVLQAQAEGNEGPDTAEKSGAPETD
jgi:uncharacterized membrane protein YkoI